MILKFAKLLLIVTGLAVAAVAILWTRSFSPADLESTPITCADETPEWSAQQPLKVLSYNVQYMASKNYVFFYDIDLENPERVAAVAKADKIIAARPSEEDVYWTLERVADVIAQEDADVVLLQEVNGADDSRTHYIDQVSELLARLPVNQYPCRTDTSYWKAEFILHPEIFGPVNMQLLTLSKYRISKSVRHQLPRATTNIFWAPFYFQRALLETHVATGNGQSVAFINSHYEAWGAGTGVMQKQIEKTRELLQSLDHAGVPWVFGGDLNLLPPDNNRQRQKISVANTGLYDEIPALKVLYDDYRGIPAIMDLLADDPRRWYTHFPNDPTVDAPDRTIDYLFYSDHWLLNDAYVRQQDTWDISDHLPVIGVFSPAVGQPALQ